MFHIETSVWFNKANYWTSFYMVTIFCKMIAQNINLKGILAQNSSIVEKKNENKNIAETAQFAWRLSRV